MKRTRLILAVLFAVFSTSLYAGDYLTNSNQSINFLRNPSRYASIGLDGIYYNPAGVSFLSDGWHFQFNWQQPKQERTSKANYGALLGANYLNPGTQEKDGTFSRYYKAKINIPIQPAIFASYNVNGWAFQLGLGIIGGGGTAHFRHGVGMFEALVANMGINTLGPAFGGYALEDHFTGESYYYAATLAVSKKITPTLSASIGVRGIYASNKYKGHLGDISFRTVAGNIIEVPTTYLLHATQKATGFAPIMGIDYKPTSYLNFSARYEFRTKLTLKTNGKKNNDAFNELAMRNAAFAGFVDGAKTSGDMPAILSVAAEVTPIEGLRISAGYLHYFDTDTKQWDSEHLSNTNEILFGVEYDITPKLEVSAGIQRTIYSQKDNNYSDLSFNLNGTSVGLGVGYKVSSKVKLNAAYFRTDYNRHTVKNDLGSTKYIRKNRVFGLGVEINF